MAYPSREATISRRSWLLAGLTASLFPLRGAEKLDVTYDGDNLHVSARTLHFLTGKPLERLKDASTVVFFSTLTLLNDTRDTEMQHARDRFVVSYDLWEEKFSVTQLGTTTRSTARLLSAAAAESWCMEGLAISAAALAPNRSFWVRFELRTVSAKELSSDASDPALSLNRFIELLSRKPGAEDPRFTGEAGPLRLADLVRRPGRGARNV